MTNDYDYINPSHYKVGGKEVYEMMIDIWGKEKYISYCEMNAFKYRMRLGHKPNQPVDRDLSKARWYEEMASNLRSELDKQEKREKIKNNFGPIINRL